MNKENKAIYAVVPAAGMSSRMNTNTGESKLFLKLEDGITLIEKTIISLAESKIFQGIVISARENEQIEMQQILAKCAPNLDNSTTIGGSTRQESVYNALKSLLNKADFVAVHDGARPNCSSQLITEVVNKALETNAAILALPIVPTLKQVERDFIIKTIPRNNIWEAQTPQVFEFKTLLRAHEMAILENHFATDDSELIERIGISVSIVLGSAKNIKITRNEDLIFLKLQSK